MEDESDRSESSSRPHQVVLFALHKQNLRIRSSSTLLLPLELLANVLCFSVRVLLFALELLSTSLSTSSIRFFTCSIVLTLFRYRVLSFFFSLSCCLFTRQALTIFFCFVLLVQLAMFSLVGSSRCFFHLFFHLLLCVLSWNSSLQKAAHLRWRNFMPFYPCQDLCHEN